MNFLRASILAILTALFAVSTATATEAPDRAAIEAIVRDYLVKNPEIIEEALTALQTKRELAQAEDQKKAVADNRKELFEEPNSIVLGNPNGDVSLVEFFDYNCGYCKRALQDIAKLIETDKKLKIVLKDFPVLGPGSIEAAAVAIGVKKQLKGEKFFAFHRELLATRGPVAKDRALEVAKNLGVDMAKLEKDMATDETKATIDAAIKLGDTIGVNGTPSYVVQNEVVVGAVGFDALEAKITAVRQCGKTSC